MKVLGIIVLSVLSFSAHAEAARLSSGERRVLATYEGAIGSAESKLSRIRNQGITTGSCQAHYQKMFSDGDLTISMAFGYFDRSSGDDQVSAQLGNGYVFDTLAAASLRSKLLSRCRQGRQSSQNCGFKQAGNGYLVKHINTQSAGKVRVLVRITNSSVTTHNYTNVTQYSSQQRNQTALAEQNFFGAIAGGFDAAIYMGHARSGGGPDFTPPVLLSNGKPNYSFYRSNQPGVSKLLGALRQSRRDIPVLGLLACKSTGLFASRVRAQSPGSVLVTAGELFEDNDVVASGYALLDAIINERCGSEFDSAVRVSPRAASFLNVIRPSNGIAP